MTPHACWSVRHNFLSEHLFFLVWKHLDNSPIPTLHSLLKFLHSSGSQFGTPTSWSASVGFNNLSKLKLEHLWQDVLKRDKDLKGDRPPPPDLILIKCLWYLRIKSGANEIRIKLKSLNEIVVQVIFTKLNFCSKWSFKYLTNYIIYSVSSRE